MTKEENLHWLNREIEGWENECQSKHPIKEALYAARKALEQEPSEDAVSRDDVVRIVQHNNPPKALEKIRKLSSVTPQDPKPMIEIDLYSVINQKYIEREVLNKIRAEIEEMQTYDGIYIDRAYVLEIIDKYKAESEG